MLFFQRFKENTDELYELPESLVFILRRSCSPTGVLQPWIMSIKINNIRPRRTKGKQTNLSNLRTMSAGRLRRACRSFISDPRAVAYHTLKISALFPSGILRNMKWESCFTSVAHPWGADFQIIPDEEFFCSEGAWLDVGVGFRPRLKVFFHFFHFLFEVLFKSLDVKHFISLFFHLNYSSYI